ncbi:MAG: MFS transporter [Phormidesmis sp.]
MQRFPLFASLRNPIFARLYAAQTTSLLGDALTWLGLALLTFELAGKDSAVVLSIALTLRVTAFVLLSPLAGVLADRLDRKAILVITHLARMCIISLLPFVNAIWQIYVLILSLNVFNAFFTPTYQATIPLVTGQKEYPQAIALSSATYQLLGVLGPGIAGAIALFVGARQIFFLDALTFLIAAILIITLPGQLRVAQTVEENATPSDEQSPLTAKSNKKWQDVREGTTRLLGDRYLRYALAMQLVVSVAGAQVLVNTVGYVQGTLALSSIQYGWAMSAFGIGATLSAAMVGLLNQRWRRSTTMLFGAVLTTLALIPASYVGLSLLLLLWLLVGAGQTLVNVSAQTLLADRTPAEFQGRVYGAQFAWSHLWWMFSYPLAGWFGSYQKELPFLSGSLIGLALLIIVQLALNPKAQKRLQESYCHEHHHTHDEFHQHKHPLSTLLPQPHTHLHWHQNTPHGHDGSF